MKAISRLYERLEDAGAAADALVDAGFDSANISLIAPHAGQSLGLDSMDDIAKDDDPARMGRGAAAGGAIGGVLGGATGLLMGLGLLVIPGVGPALAIGPLASTLAGIGLGGASGGVAGAIAQAGLPPLESNEYSKALKRGEIMLFVNVPKDRAVEAGRILDSYGPIGQRDRRTAMLEGGREDTAIT